jgi:hypothetical protein
MAGSPTTREINFLLSGDGADPFDPAYNYSPTALEIFYLLGRDMADPYDPDYNYSPSAREIFYLLANGGGGGGITVAGAFDTLADMYAAIGNPPAEQYIRQCYDENGRRTCGHSTAHNPPKVGLQT